MRNRFCVGLMVAAMVLAAPVAHAQSAGGSSSSGAGASSPGGAGSTSSGAGFSSGGPSPSSLPSSGGSARRKGANSGKPVIGGTTAADQAEQKRSDKRMTICKGC